MASFSIKINKNSLLLGSMSLHYQFSNPKIHQKVLIMSSDFLKREIGIDIFEVATRQSRNKMPTILFNDGQLLLKMNFKRILRKLIRSNLIKPCVIIAIHSSEARINEYGTTQFLAENNLGANAGAYQNFITEELIPYIGSPKQLYMAGFSLGGLSALDIALNNPKIFKGVGVFSGALWWRSQPYTTSNPDAHLIIPQKIKQIQIIPKTTFWFQAGTLDETSDRNKNGIIDSIDDTHITINALREIGIPHNQIHYLEKRGGKHNLTTWANVMSHFLVWACK